MAFLYKFYFFDPAKEDTKSNNEIFIAFDSIDFFTRYKMENSTKEGTRLQTNIFSGLVKPSENATIFKNEFISHVISGIPENVNSYIFDLQFFKTTIQYLHEGSFKKYTSWINTENIACVYAFQPDSCEIFLKSGCRLICAAKLKDFMAAFGEHTKQIKQRRAEKYAANKKA